jgi:hypothetical protein
MTSGAVRSSPARLVVKHGTMLGLEAARYSLAAIVARRADHAQAPPVFGAAKDDGTVGNREDVLPERKAGTELLQRRDVGAMTRFRARAGRNR